nr:hypothetical protein Iba_chr13aCG5920 [Ipomoea batatas]
MKSGKANLVALATSTSGEGKVEAFSHIAIVQSSPSRVRQGLISLLDLDEPLRVLLDPIRRRNIRVILPGQLLVRLLDLQQRSRLRFTLQEFKMRAAVGCCDAVDCG